MVSRARQRAHTKTQCHPPGARSSQPPNPPLDTSEPKDWVTGAGPPPVKTPVEPVGLIMGLSAASVRVNPNDIRRLSCSILA